MYRAVAIAALLLAVAISGEAQSPAAAPKAPVAKSPAHAPTKSPAVHLAPAPSTVEKSPVPSKSPAPSTDDISPAPSAAEGPLPDDDSSLSPPEPSVDSDAPIADAPIADAPGPAADTEHKKSGAVSVGAGVGVVAGGLVAAWVAVASL